MPIAMDSRDKIDQNFVLLPDYVPVQAVRNEVGHDPWKYVIIELADGSYAVFYLAHLVEALQKGGGITTAVLAQPLDTIPDLLNQFRTQTVDIATEELGRAYKQASKTPLKLLVALENGAVVGILTTPAAASRSDVPSVDLSRLPINREAFGFDLEMSAPPGPGEKGISLDDLSLSMSEALPLEPRFMNVELHEGGTQIQPETTPLEKEKPYYLSFFVDSVVSEAHIGGSGTEIGGEWFGDDEEEIALTIQLKSDDFRFDFEAKNLYVPRTGRSDRERFQITPLHDGACQITAVVLKGNAFVQVITLKFHVGPLFTVETLGRNLDSAPRLAPRDLHLTFLPENDGYRVILSGPVAATAHLPLNRRYLAHLVAQARKTLHEIVHFELGDVRRYQVDLQIPPVVNDRMLIKLANAGYDLFDQIFYGPGHDLQARQIGDAMRKMAREQNLRLQIFSQNFMLPWGIMYVGDDPDAPDPEMFFGLRHIIEHIPLQPNMQVFDHEIDVSDGLHVSLNVSTDIDQQMGQPFIGRQLAEWETITQAHGQTIKVEVRHDHLSVLEALNAGDAPDEVMYFYCHAESFDLNEPEKGTPDYSRLIFNNHQALTLRRLSRNRELLAGQPLVFINACESAELSPEFYDGFVPYFVNKGARGVIGTECETPALFAEAFAKQFFAQFLKGERSLGEIFLALRRDFYFERNNLLGLVYALYVDGDTKLSATAVG